MAKRKRNQTVREFHALGQIISTVAQVRKNSGLGIWGTYESLGATTATQKNRRHEARAFAELYDERELDWLCGLGADGGKPLTKTHVTMLIRVANRQRRNSLAERCSKLGWSVKRLEDEIRRVGPRRKYGGRGPAPPSTEGQALAITERHTAIWNRWYLVLQASAKSGRQPALILDELPPAVRKALNTAAKEMKLLGKILQRELDGRVGQTAPPPRRKR